MNLLDILLHLLNFVAPALGLAALLPLFSRLFMKKRAFLLPWWGQILLNFVLGVAALSLALWWLGHDGRMQGYALLVLVVGSSQWILARGWR